MKDLIIQQGVGQYKPHIHLCRPFHRYYAGLVGASFESIDYAFEKEYSLIEKFTVPLSYMTRSGRRIWMLDADALIVGDDDFRKDLAEVDFAAVRNVWGDWNTGSVFYRDTWETIDFLTSCIDLFASYTHAFGKAGADQILVNRMVSNFRLKCQALNRRWNEYDSAGGELDGKVQVRAWHNINLSAEQKLEQMTKFVEDRKRASKA